MTRIWEIFKDRNKFMEILTKKDIPLLNSNKFNLKCGELITNNYYKSIYYVLGEILKIYSQCLAVLSKKEGNKFTDKFGTETGFYKEKYVIIKKIEQDFIKKQWSFSFSLYRTPEYDQLYCNIKFFYLL
jgi:hypothetical protein